MPRKNTRSRATPRRWSSDRIVSLTAILISIGTFLVFIYQTNLIREEQYMSVYPYLEFSNYASESPNFRFKLENNGVGPAMITGTRVLVNGEIRARDIGDYLAERLTLADSIYFTISNIRKGNLIPEKEEIELVVLQPPTSQTGSVRLFNMIYNDSLEFIIEYASIYGEKWILSTRAEGPRKVE